jgi:hypothetical protein
MKEVDQYFMNQPEPFRECMLYMRELILGMDQHIVETWKYRMPIYCYNKKMCCYLWVHKKYQQAYLGIVEGKLIDHPDLIQEKRARMKIMLLDPTKDVPVRKVKGILSQVLKHYKSRPSK